MELPPRSRICLINKSKRFNAHIAGKTLDEARQAILTRLKSARNELDTLAESLVDQGLAT